MQLYFKRKKLLIHTEFNKSKLIYDVHVVRDGNMKIIKNVDVVVGDVIKLEAPCKVPADGILIDGDNICICQSSDGEYIRKDVKDPFLTTDTIVTSGTGTMIVLRVGQIYCDRLINTFPLQRRVEIIGERIGEMANRAFLLIFSILIIFWVVNMKKANLAWGYIREPVCIIAFICAFIVCDPQQWPSIVHIMSLEHVKRKLSSDDFNRFYSMCLTDSAPVICTSKTGILTTEKMDIEQYIINDKIYLSNDFLNLPQEIKTLISFHHHETTQNILKCFQFDQFRRLMSTIIRQGDQYIIHVKGSPESILKQCTKYYTENGRVKTITETFLQRINTLIQTQSSQGFYTIGIAYKATTTLPETHEIAESELTFIGILCYQNPIRINSRSSVISCQRSGCNVIMITGDSLSTSKSIAKECHLLTKNKIAIEAEDIHKMSNEEFDKIFPRISVVSRATPKDKQFIVRKLQEKGQNVIVLGDINHNSNEIESLNYGNDFETISKCIVMKQNIFHNVQRFLQFYMITLLSTLFLTLITSFFLYEFPFSPFEILISNLILPLLSSIIFSNEEPRNNRINNRKLITSFMKKNIIFQVVFQIVIFIFILMYPPKNHRPFAHYHYTFIFNVFMFCQMANLINVRATERNENVFVGINKSNVLIKILCAIIVFMFCFLQFAGTLCNCPPLELKEWVLSVLAACASLWVGMICRRNKMDNSLYEKLYQFTKVTENY